MTSLPAPLPGLLRALLLWLLTVVGGSILVFGVLLLSGTESEPAQAFQSAMLACAFAGVYSLLTVPLVYLLFRLVLRLLHPVQRWTTAGLALTGLFVLPVAIFGISMGGLTALWTSGLLRHALLYLPAVWGCAALLYHPWLSRPTSAAQGVVAGKAVR